MVAQKKATNTEFGTYLNIVSKVMVDKDMSFSEAAENDPQHIREELVRLADVSTDRAKYLEDACWARTRAIN